MVTKGTFNNVAKISLTLVWIQESNLKNSYEYHLEHLCNIKERKSLRKYPYDSYELFKIDCLSNTVDVLYA